MPPGFAHGFLVVSETADVLYKITNYSLLSWEGRLPPWGKGLISPVS